MGINRTALPVPTDPIRIRRHVVVIGGGAAGLVAAVSAAKAGGTVTLLEKSERVGMKILISGGGKCNITHDGGVEELLRAFRRNEALFLKPSFYRFTRSDILTVLHERAIPTYVRPDGRVFPIEPKNAKDVVAALERWVRSSGAAIKTSAPVTGIICEDGRAVGVVAGEETIAADAVVLAAGGSSYPATGTTGDGWRWAEQLGHRIVPLRAALAPIYLREPRADWSGVTLTDVKLSARLAASGKQIARWTGDLLFTHKGVSGPCALGISREIAEAITPQPNICISLYLDLLQSCSYEDAVQTAQEDIDSTVASYVQRLLPKRLAEDAIGSLGLQPQAKLTSLGKKRIGKLISGMKDWQIGVVRAVPLERGEVVAGGISLDEIDPKTMRSKIVNGLYLCGEILDIAGPVGGYNLQAAWSTGYVAGESAALSR